MYMYKKGLY